MKLFDILFAIKDLFAIVFALIQILGGEPNFGAYIWLIVAVLWGVELALKWTEAKSNKGAMVSASGGS